MKIDEIIHDFLLEQGFNTEEKDKYVNSLYEMVVYLHKDIPWTSVNNLRIVETEQGRTIVQLTHDEDGLIDFVKIDKNPNIIPLIRKIESKLVKHLSLDLKSISKTYHIRNNYEVEKYKNRIHQPK